MRRWLRERDKGAISPTAVSTTGRWHAASSEVTAATSAGSAAPSAAITPAAATAQAGGGLMVQIPEVRLRVFQAGSGTQDLSILGPLATPVYCEANDRFTPRVIWPIILGVRCEHLMAACLPA
eukprot:203807-Prorocentrum_minimum.AAC.1